MANVIKERSSLALHMAKAAVDQGRNHDLYTALEIEARNDAMLFDTADFREDAGLFGKTSARFPRQISCKGPVATGENKS